MRLLSATYPAVLALVMFLIACDLNKTSSSGGEDVSDNIARIYQEQGRSFAKATFTALSSELQSALAQGGVREAVQYCNLNAIPLVDSLSDLYQANIRRTSLQWRNAANAPTRIEEGFLEDYTRRFEAGEDLVSRVVSDGEDHMRFLAPIIVAPFCLQCHGEVGKDISEADYSTIKGLYAGDKAINYQGGDFRGIWSIKLKRRGAGGR